MKKSIATFLSLCAFALCICSAFATQTVFTVTNITVAPYHPGWYRSDYSSNCQGEVCDPLTADVWAADEFPDASQELGTVYNCIFIPAGSRVTIQRDDPVDGVSATEYGEDDESVVLIWTLHCTSLEVHYGAYLENPSTFQRYWPHTTEGWVSSGNTFTRGYDSD